MEGLEKYIMENKTLVITMVGVVLMYGVYIFKYWINYIRFRQTIKRKSTDDLMTMLTENKSLNDREKTWLFDYIQNVRKSAILRPQELNKRQNKSLPKGKHYVMSKKKMKK